MIRIINSQEIDQGNIFDRSEAASQVEDVVQGILQGVRQNGDAAVKKYCEKFDGAVLDSLLVSAEEIDTAYNAMAPEFIQILREAAQNITAFHQKQVKTSFIISDTPGVVLGQKVIPLGRVGLYVPGGTAAYPSSVLMNALPAKIAGVKELVMVTPPAKDGSINPVILAAARVAGVDKIYKVGGAQAIAALAYGTESISRVDKIVGPGNAYVAEAKKQVYGQVAIDMIAGPSEILIIADGTCNPRYVAADLLSQAEHDRLASAVLVTNSPALAYAVQTELEKQIPLLPRAAIARHSIDAFGKIIITSTLEEALEISNAIAPEHLEICVDNPFDYLDAVQNAGSVFLGKSCPEPLGDYFAGPNHTLPTGGTARFSSPLSVDEFVKKTAFTYYTPAALAKVGEKVAYFAEKEGLSAHARAVTVRLEDVQ